MIKIGATNWVRDLKRMTEPLGSDIWADFRLASEEELLDVERKLQRKLDPEFREFYRTIGYGDFRDVVGGGFYAPESLMTEPSAPIYFITGSLTPKKEWATLEQHNGLWLSRGRDNPASERFTDEVMTLDGVKLYDLLPFGSNGCCCYHQLYVGPEPAPLRYCLLTDSQTMEDRSMTFSDGLEKILGFYLQTEE